MTNDPQDSRIRSIAAASQNKRHQTVRAHAAEDRISVKGRDGVWRDYTADEAARGYHLSAFLKDQPKLTVDPAEEDETFGEEDDEEPDEDDEEGETLPKS